MLKLELSARDAGAPWRWRDGRWEVGGGWVEPYAHEALEAFHVTDGSRTFAVVRERATGAVPPERYDRAVDEAKRWPLDQVVLESSPSGVTVTAGVWGAAPVYLTCADGVLRGSWDLTDLRGALDVAAVAGMLRGGSPYTMNTLFRGVHRLTERATATFAGGRLDLAYPEPADAYAVRDLRDDADPVDAFVRILTTAIARGPARDRVAVEVSGGMDSAMVLLAAADVFGPSAVASFGLLIAGPAADQQRTRRQALLRGVPGVVDTTVDAVSRLPFSPGGRRASGARFSPYEEPYLELLELLLAKMTGAGYRTVLTGMGGDELMTAPLWEALASFPPTVDDGLPDVRTALVEELAASADRDRAPLSVLPESALQASACRAPAFLRAGCWAVHPLCAPELVRFCQWLPSSWRAGKRLPRLHLRRLGYEPSVVRPPLVEHFGEVMQLGLRRHALGMLTDTLDSSVLVGLGLVDPAALRWVLASCRADPSRPVPDALYEVANLELGLRSLLRM